MIRRPPRSTLFPTRRSSDLPQRPADLEHPHEPIGIAVRKRPEQDFACQAEDRGVDPEAQGQRRDGHNRENGTRSKRSQRSPDVQHHLASRQRLAVRKVRATTQQPCCTFLLILYRVSAYFRVGDKRSGIFLLHLEVLVRSREL